MTKCSKEDFSTTQILTDIVLDQTTSRFQLTALTEHASMHIPYVMDLWPSTAIMERLQITSLVLKKAHLRIRNMRSTPILFRELSEDIHTSILMTTMSNLVLFSGKYLMMSNALTWLKTSQVHFPNAVKISQRDLLHISTRLTTNTALVLPKRSDYLSKKPSFEEGKIQIVFNDIQRLFLFSLQAKN